MFLNSEKVIEINRDVELTPNTSKNGTEFPQRHFGIYYVATTQTDTFGSMEMALGVETAIHFRSPGATTS